MSKEFHLYYGFYSTHQHKAHNLRSAVRWYLSRSPHRLAPVKRIFSSRVVETILERGSCAALAWNGTCALVDVWSRSPYIWTACGCVSRAPKSDQNHMRWVRTAVAKSCRSMRIFMSNRNACLIIYCRGCTAASAVARASRLLSTYSSRPGPRPMRKSSSRYLVSEGGS